LNDIIVNNCTCLFSYGYGMDSRFEEDYYSRYNKPIFIYDHTNFYTGEPCISEEKIEGGIKFYPEGLGAKAKIPTPGFLFSCDEKCEDFINHYNREKVEGLALLKIDIESNEYPYFNNTDLDRLSSIAGAIVIEFHHVCDYIDILHVILKKLHQNFIPCHLHANNYCYWEYKDIKIPKALEVTFINKILVEKYEKEIDLSIYPLKDIDFPSNNWEDTDLSFFNKLDNTFTITDTINELNHFYFKFENWFNFQKFYSKIVENANDNSHFVEIGVWNGSSTAYMGVEIYNSGKKIKFDAIDCFETGNDYTINDNYNYNKVKENLIELINYNVVNLIKNYSIDASNNYENESIDFCFLDGDSSYDGVKVDILNWLPKIKKGGILAGHDYDPYHEGVYKAVNDTLGEKNILKEDGYCFVYYKN